MTFFIETLDARNIKTEKLLKDFGYAVKPISALHQAKMSDILVFPPNKKFEDNFLKSLPPNTRLFCGNLNPLQLDILKNKNILHLNVMEDEIFAIKNSILTAEGVLANIIEKTQKSVFEQNFLILGTGRSGKAIAKIFSDLKLNFSLSSFDEKNFALASIFSKKNYYKDSVFKALNNFDVIINTVPAKIISPQHLSAIKPQALYLEISSIQSIDTKSLHFEYVPCPALPLKFASSTAGEYLFEAIIRAVEKTS